MGNHQQDPENPMVSDSDEPSLPGRRLRYGATFIRFGVVCAAFITATGLWGAGAAVATGGYPADVDEPAGSCSFSLSPPHTTSLGSRTDVITATIAPVRCSGHVQPSRSTVCVKPPGSTGSCSMAYAWNTAQVFYPPASGEAAFTATGEGCWNGFRPQDWGCTALKPDSSAD